jgi:hypothetical protein
MSIQFQCTNCGRKLNAPDGSGGARVRCRGCSAVMRVPTAELNENALSPPAAAHTAESAKGTSPVAAHNPTGSTNQSPEAPRVSAALRKVCASCGVDLTFVKRNRQSDGSFLCQSCNALAEAAAAESAAAPIASTAESIIPACEECGRELSGIDIMQLDGKMLCSECFAFRTGTLALNSTPSGRSKELPSEIFAPLASARRRSEPVPERSMAGIIWLGISIAAVLALAIGIPTWSHFHHPDQAAEVVRSNNGLETSPQPARPQSQPPSTNTKSALPPAVTLNRNPLSHITAGRNIAPRAAAVPALPADLLFRHTPAYQSLKAESDRIVQSLHVDLIAEDSAYRGISRRTLAARDLLSVYIRVSTLANQSLLPEIQRIITSSDTDLIGESSAIRAAWHGDEAVFSLLCLWGKAMEASTPGIATKVGAIESDVKTSLIGDDSAPRTIAADIQGSYKVLAEIAGTNGWGDEAQKIIAARRIDRISDDSAWQDAAGNADAMFRMTLLFAEHHPSAATRQRARSIESAVRAAMIGEDSALRAQSHQWDGFIDVLHLLIVDPPR